MRYALIAITDSSLESAGRLQPLLADSHVVDARGKGVLKRWVEENTHEYEGLIFFMALGIVYRVLEGHLIDKYHDPAVVVVDDACRYAIAALSGHEGGANELAWTVARLLGAHPVITTASDTNRDCIIGIGCRRGTSADTLKEAVREGLRRAGIELSRIRLCSSAWLKRDERGLIEACRELELPLTIVSEDRLSRFSGTGMVSGATVRRYGIEGVAEPCAILEARDPQVLLPRSVISGVTIAIVQEGGTK